MYKVPSPFNIRTIRSYLKEFESIFKSVGKRIPNAVLVANNPQFDITGALIFYKTIEYIIKKNCLFKPRLKGHDSCIDQMNKFGFGELLRPYFNQRAYNLFSLKYHEYNGVFVAPFVLKDEECTQEVHRYAPNIEAFYSDPTITYSIFQCKAELQSNFAEHAMDDTDTILVASGNKQSFEIVCADTGVGIVSSLRPSLNADRFIPSEDVLEMATKEGVTSKKNTSHMGYGLWLVCQLVEAQRGELHIYSEGFYFMSIEGKVKKGRCGYWKGTIIYISLPLQNLEGIKSVKEHFAQKYDDIKLSVV